MNEYYSIERSNSLRHHGILGMKWGRQQGPPYPLGASDHSDSERKAGWRKSLDGKNKNLYDRKYHVETKRSGHSSIKDEEGNKIKGSTRRKIERDMKKELKATNKEEYREYKRIKEAASTSFMYLGQSQSMAMMTLAMNAMTAEARNLGKERLNNMIADYANVKYEDFIKNGGK